MDDELLRLLSGADRALGRLDGASSIVPNPDLFVYMYGRKESLLSSQIEGTRTSLVELLEYERDPERKRDPEAEPREVTNHLQALLHGIDRLKSLPVCNRLLQEIHSVLMKDVRGAERRPGAFRQMQNFIGPPGSTIKEAQFVPPPPREVPRLMGDFERYIHADTDTPPLIKVGLLHYQFETIHPFEDGNGRMGRLLITFLLAEQTILSSPLLYLSVFLKEHREEYFRLLNQVREQGDYESWMKFFLRGMRQVSLEATETVRQSLAMREAHIALVREKVASAHAPSLIDFLFREGGTRVNEAAQALGISYPTANNMIRTFEQLGLLTETTGRSRDRIFLYLPYIRLLGGDSKPSP